MSQVDPDALLSPREIGALILNAFNGSVSPAWGGQPLSEVRLGYCRNFAQILMSRLEAQDIATRHMTYTEAVSMLLGTALAVQMLHCHDREVDAKEKAL